MNFIDNIEIKNFKSIRHQKIEGCKRVNVFIGYPNVGKSNILEALALFSIDDQSPDFSSFIRIENLTTLFFNANIEKQSEIKINDKHRFVARFKTDSILFMQQFERDGTSFEKEDTGMMFLDESSDVWNKKMFQLGEGKEKKIFNYSGSVLGKENELAIFKRYDFLKKISYLSSGVFSLSYPYGENIFSIISSNSLLKKEVEELFKPYSLELLYDTREQKFAILKRTNTGIFSIPYELVADTLQRLIFYKAAIMSNKNCVLLFEEPEAHMFPPYISKFTSDIVNDENINQYFITTHSPFVLNDLIANVEKEEVAVYIVSYEQETGESLVHRMNDDDIHEAYQFGYDFFMNIDQFIPQKQHG